MFYPCLLLSVHIFLKLEEALELLNSLDSDESDFEIAVLPAIIAVLPDTSDEEGDDIEVTVSESIKKDVPGSLEVRNGDSFQSEPLTISSVSTTKSRKKSQKTSVIMDKE
ncbi:hypothetical protein TNCV_1949581 [Trichonephila clavipes]|nr:hypothetical protein TNCV_1949581 [Trichonephila clavipes]